MEEKMIYRVELRQGDKPIYWENVAAQSSQEACEILNDQPWMKLPNHMWRFPNSPLALVAEPADDMCIYLPINL